MALYLSFPLSSLATSSIFKKFTIDSDEKMDILLEEKNDKKTRKTPKIDINENVPSPIDLPPGCIFADRCNSVNEKCKEIEPQMVEIRKGHFVKCNYLKKESVL